MEYGSSKCQIKWDTSCGVRRLNHYPLIPISALGISYLITIAHSVRIILKMCFTACGCVTMPSVFGYWIRPSPFHVQGCLGVLVTWWLSFLLILPLILLLCSQWLPGVFGPVATNCEWNSRFGTLEIRSRKPRNCCRNFEICSGPVQNSRVHVMWCAGSLLQRACSKLIFDGTTFDNLALAGLGVVIRDEQGMIIAALSQQIPLPSSVNMVEALATRRALIFAQEISISSVEVEGDSLQVIRAINKKEQDRSW